MERKLGFVTVIEAAQVSRVDGADNLALAREARAFNLGLEHAGWQDFTHIGKLDGDVELPSEWFAALLERFRERPRLGLAGGRLIEPSPAGWHGSRSPTHHVHGAVKLFTCACLEDIGGIPERLGWDTIDETYARMRGYETHSFADLVAKHHRHWGSADGRLRGRARHGECAWILHYGLGWVLLRSVKVALGAAARSPGSPSYTATGGGGSAHAARRRPPVPPLRRRELRRRMLPASAAR